MENKNSKQHTYIVREKVLVSDKKANKYQYPYKGPCPITKVWGNGNVTIRQGSVQERVNIKRIKPYK